MVFKSVQLMQQKVLMNTVNGVCNASGVMVQDLPVLQVRGYSISYSLPFLFTLILLVGFGLKTFVTWHFTAHLCSGCGLAEQSVPGSSSDEDEIVTSSNETCM